MEDIKDSLMWFGVVEVLSLLGAVLFFTATRSHNALIFWAWLNVGVLSVFSLVALAFSIISAIVGIKKITKKGE